MAVQRRSKKPGWQKTIARERIAILFAEAAQAFRAHPGRAHRYAQIARRIAMRYNIRLPKDLKRRLCKKCYAYLVPGANMRVRARPSQQAVIFTCGECGAVSRIPYRKEKAERR